MRILNTIGDWVSSLKSRVRGRGYAQSFHLRETVGYKWPVLCVASLLATSALGQVSVLTAQYDNNRSAANLNETLLNTSNVNEAQFGRLFSRSLDGYLYAQPLYVPNVAIPGQGTHNIVYVATLHNTVAAFDADDPSQATPFWQVNLGPTVPCCPTAFLTPEIGIVSTPVVDPGTSTLYVVAATLENGSYFHRLHALDITSGQEKFGGPVTIQASFPGTGSPNQDGFVLFDSQLQLQRAGLLLANGAVYVAFAAIDEGTPWHGWLIGYNASNIQQQVSVYNSTPDGDAGGIWQSGRGLVSDATGNLYFMTGNGDYDGTNNFGDSMVKLSSAATTTEDWFTPDNQLTLSLQDEDLGSSGPLLIPNTTLLVGGGKQGILYVVDSSNMGHFQTGNGQIVQSFQATSGEIHHVAYWDNFGAPLLYLWGSNDVLKAFQFGNGTFNTTPVAQSGLNAFFPGGMLAVSANGSTPGTGIVWATTATSDTSYSVAAGTLRAFDASDVSHVLWDSDQNAARDTLGNFAKFASPTIANGKVYVPTFSNQLAVYGLVANTPPGVSIWVGPASATLTANGQQQFTATVAGTSNTAVTWSMSPSLGTLTANGLYTAPVVSSSQTVTITATSVADPTKSANAAVTLTPVVTTGTAAFVGLDTTIQGNWKGVYGGDGHNIINDTVAYPSYVTVTPAGVNATTWASSSTDVRALLKAASSTDRIAATWYTSSSFLIDMVFNDGLQHQLAIYCLDWDTTSRAERIDILDANGVVLNTQNVSNFHNGQYLVWQLSGHVQVRVTNLGNSNAVISGLFFDSGTPTVAVSVSPASATLTANGQQQFTAAVRGTNNTAVTWSMNPSVGTLTTSGLYTAPATISSAQTITITATSVADTSKSANATVTLSTATNSAKFVTLDTTTQGNWKGVYGSNGYNVINDTVAYPSYVTVTPSGVNATTWASSTTDERALLTASGTNRIAAAWYNASPFLIDMVFNDGLQHQVAIYCLDWDSTTRAERIDILDANGVLLNTQNVSNFHNGQYLVWQLSGHVQVRVTNLNSNSNAVISGLFFDTTAPASSFALTGPSGGALNTASTNFTVTPNGTYNGTITITPSGGGLSTAITLTYSNSAASQTFTITPTAVGPVTLTPSNNGSLSNPPALLYATPPGVPTIGTATAGNGQATVAFTPPGSAGGSTITSYTATCGSQSVSGPGSPITVTGLTNGTTYTCTVTATNAAGVSAPSAASNSVTPNGVASSFALTGPSGGALNTASTNFTVTPNGTYNGTITITPSGGGLSTAITLTYSNSAASQTFTITPTAVGPVTLTPSNNGSLSNPPALLYATPPGVPTIGTATAGNGQATVAFTPPGSAGGSTITSYTATCGSQSVSGTASPIAVTGLTNGTTYTCTVTATNAAGVSAPSAASNSVTPGTGTTTGTATFMTLDTTTQGNWKGVYGSNGYNVINNTVAYPSYVTVTPSSANPFTWASSTTDVRALLTAASGTNRIAATWYNSSSFLIDMVFNDGLQHQVAIYCLDWDSTTRAERIDILDANGVLLNTQNVSNFHNGQYLVWQLSGHVQVRVTNLNSNSNAVISGLFFDTTAPASSFALTGPSGGALNTASTNFTVTPNGTYNGTITITPSGGGLSAAITQTFNHSAASQTFTITPTAVGPVTLTPSNNGSLTNPVALTYATPPGVPTIGTATAGNAQATVTFTPPGSTGGSAITSYTATCGSQSVSGPGSPITVTGLTNGTTYTCTVTASNVVGISASSAASNSVTPNGVASSFALTGPSGGALNTASTNFTVTPNGTYNGTITITPSGGGLSTAITLTYSNSAALQTFTITPTAVGPVTLTPSNNGSLSNPPALLYATPPGVPTIGTATAGNGQATVAFTPPGSAGGSTITSYTATCGSQSVSGPGSPITVTGLTNGTTYTCTVTATNAAGVSAPSAASNSVTPNGVASSFALTGPSGGALNTASTNFTVTPNGTYNGTITITPSGGGLSTAITLTYSNSAASQTFTITPTAVGPVTLTPSNNGSLSNPPALLYATPPGVPTIGTATAGNGQATVAFTPPGSAGGSTITSYTATCGSQSVSGTASPIAVTGLTNGTTYTCTVTATNAAGVSAPSAASNSVTPGTGTTTGTATFMTLDTTTQGNWKGVYGSNGYNVINNTVAYPSYVTVTPSSANPFTWASSTTDVRALLTAASGTNRIAATWYNSSSFLIDMVFNDGLQHQVAIYCLDWDSTTRAERIDILDANGVLLNTQNVSNFHNGQYLVWQLSGHVQVRVTNLNSNSNAVISGLFF